MPNDAKLGLVVGVALVIGVAVIIWRKDANPGQPPAGPNPARAVYPSPSAARPPHTSYLPGQVRTVTRPREQITENSGDTPVSALPQKSPEP